MSVTLRYYLPEKMFDVFSARPWLILTSARVGGIPRVSQSRIAYQYSTRAQAEADFALRTTPSTVLRRPVSDSNHMHGEKVMLASDELERLVSPELGEKIEKLKTSLEQLWVPIAVSSCAVDNTSLRDELVTLSVEALQQQVEKLYRPVSERRQL